MDRAQPAQQGTLAGRVLAGLFALMIVASFFPIANAIAQQGDARDTEDACANAPEDGFTDTGADGTALEEAIDCIAWYAITSGIDEDEYAPSQDISRAQMATFMADKMRQGETDFAETSEDFFEDDDTSVHEQNINFVAEHEVVEGFEDGDYHPNEPVSRAQMASYLVNQLRAMGANLPEASEDYFTDDDGSTHEDNINVLAEIGITSGVEGDEYQPDGTVPRSQMALFVSRDLDYLVEQGLMAPPDERGPDVPTVIDGPEFVRYELTEDAAPSPAPTANETESESGGINAAPQQASPSPDEDDTQAVRFIFDQPVEEGTADPSAFKIYDEDANATEASAAGVDPDDDTAVIVEFPADDFENAVLLAVAHGAVSDAEDVGNPERAIPLEGDSLHPATDAPDLTGVTVDEEDGPAGTTNKVVTFTFDEAVTLDDASGFYVYESDGTRTQLPSGLESGCAEGDEEDEVVCTVNDQESGDAFTAADEAVLGAVIAEAVSDPDTGASNYENSSTITPAAGPTSSPSPAPSESEPEPAPSETESESCPTDPICP